MGERGSIFSSFYGSTLTEKKNARFIVVQQKQDATQSKIGFFLYFTIETIL